MKSFLCYYVLQPVLIFGGALLCACVTLPFEPELLRFGPLRKVALLVGALIGGLIHRKIQAIVDRQADEATSGKAQRG